MDFKKDNVYSAVNADTLKPGTKAIFAENMEQLKRFVEEGIGIDCVKIRLHGKEDQLGHNFANKKAQADFLKRMGYEKQI